MIQSEVVSLIGVLRLPGVNREILKIWSIFN